MKLNQLALGLSLVSLFAITGCGSEADNDPLAGKWSNSGCFGTTTKPADIESCTTELSFSNDLQISLEATWISLSATATHPGCTTTKRVTGQQWSTDHANDTFTVDGTGKSTIERTNCVNMVDDMKETSTTEIKIPSGNTTYTLDSDKLTLPSGSLKGVYTRNLLP